MTRSDVSNAIRKVARHGHNLSKAHWAAVVKIVNYLRSTPNLGLTFMRGNRSGLHRRLVAYADSDYARSKEHRRSVSGGVVMYCRGPILWFSRTQRCVTLSSTEAEYEALAECLKEVLFVRQIVEYSR